MYVGENRSMGVKAPPPVGRNDSGRSDACKYSPCPHSCASTQFPMATVPVTTPYIAQKGDVRGLAGSRTCKAATPPTVQRAVRESDAVRYPSDLPVSGSKQSAGMTFRMSYAEGNRSSAMSNALPWRPERATPLRSCNFWGGRPGVMSFSVSCDVTGIIRSSSTTAAVRWTDGRRLVVCRRCVGANADERGTPRASVNANE